MIDYLAIGVTHLLLLVVALRLLSRGDLDREEAPARGVAPPQPVATMPVPAPVPPPVPESPSPHGVARLPRRPRGGGRA